MSAAIVCGKRSSSYFEELVHAAGSPPSAKRARFVGSSSSAPPAWTRAVADLALVANLSARFPVMSIELIQKALEESGNDLDLAIRSLINLHLDPVENNFGPACETLNPIVTEVPASAEGVTDGNKVIAHSECIPSQNLPSDGSEWVGLLVHEISSASNMEDAKARASRLLEAFEKAVIPRDNAQALHEFQKENIKLREQARSLTKDNNTLKEVSKRLFELLKDGDVKDQEIHQMKQLIAQYQEQVRTLEVNNYALSMHLRQAQQNSSIPGRYHPDVF